MALEASPLLDYLGPPSTAELALADLSEPVRHWFSQRFTTPTTAQRLAWPAFADGNNLLITAPTGHGKTWAAFAPILSTLQQEPRSGGVRCLYLAPLKALIHDVRRNLKRARQELKAFAGDTPLRIGQRTGDTPERVRRVLRRRPPDVFLTTPETLALLLAQPFAESLFGKLRWVVVDEVHALAVSKRGADLALSLERLQALTREPLQRIGLSATCAPLSAAAGFLAGAERPCRIAVATDRQRLELTIEPLEPFGSGFLRSLLDRLDPELHRNRTTLIFTNVRSLAERLTWALRRRYPDWAEQIGVHHSSLSRGRRRDVERRLKAGQLRAVVSSTSLELGIDIGSVDGVILVHPPGSAVRLLQRVGRSGHAPDMPRRGLVLTSTPAELLEAAVTGASSRAAQVEPLAIPEQPLDVLCQQLVGMAAQRSWAPDEAYDLVRRAFPYRTLSRTDFDDCLAYLSGLDRTGQPWLPERLSWIDGEFVILDDRTARVLRRNIGTILADEPRNVVLQSARDGAPPDPCAAVGQVDEPFAERLQPGDRFLLDGRCLEFRRLEGHTLIVEEVSGYTGPPRWQGSGWPLASELARRIYLLRIQAAEALRDGPEELLRLLQTDYGLGVLAATALSALFQRQECVSEIPDTRTCLVEVVDNGWLQEHYVHTPLNRSGNDALARAAIRRLLQRGRSATSIVADLGFQLSLSGKPLTPDDLASLLEPSGFEDDLQAALADSWSVREAFQRTALTGLMLLRNPLGQRRRVGGHDWAERRLFEQVSAVDPDFVLLRQARREVCTGLLDIPAARSFVQELPQLTIRWRRLADVSPLAESWTQPAAGAAESVLSPAEALEQLHSTLMGRLQTTATGD